MSGIDSSRLLAEMSRMANAANGGSVVSATNPANPIANDLNISDVKGSNFSEMFSSAIGNVNNLQMTAGDLSNRLVKGDPNVTIAETMIAGQKSSVAFEATIQVRNKLVQAYQDIMNMPL
jgi:flagellar hook-basal body complex protein FliE